MIKKNELKVNTKKEVAKGYISNGLGFFQGILFFSKISHNYKTAKKK
jgi:hypothetical protein